MRQYEMTLVAISEKRVKISAESAEAAAQMVEKIYSETNILDFFNRDVTDVSVHAKAADGDKLITLSTSSIPEQTGGL